MGLLPINIKNRASSAYSNLYAQQMMSYIQSKYTLTHACNKERKKNSYMVLFIARVLDTARGKRTKLSLNAKLE